MSSVAAYIRVSTEEQVQQDTLINQRTLLEGPARLHQLHLCDIYADEGVSGTLPLAARPAGARLLEDARSGRIRRVLVCRLDRLGRNARQLLNDLAALEALGVSVASITESFDAATPAGKLLLTMLAGFAGYERDSIVERTTTGSRRVAAEGAWMGGWPPYGYRVVGQRREARLSIDDEPIPGHALSPAQVVTWIYSHIAHEGGSLVSAARRLNDLGIPTRSSLVGIGGEQRRGCSIGRALWYPTTIRKIVTSLTYRGVHVYGKRGEAPISRPCPALVDDETWERAQRRLRENFLHAKRTSRRSYLLAGLITCVCGARMQGRGVDSPSGSEYRYYVCNRRLLEYQHLANAGEPCREPYLQAALVETLVWGQLLALVRNHRQAVADLGKASRQVDSEREPLEEHRAALEQVIAGKADERERILAAYRRGLIDVVMLEREFTTIDRETAALRRQLEAVAAEREASSLTQQYLADAEVMLLRLGAELCEDTPLDRQREVLLATVRGIQLLRDDGQRMVRLRMWRAVDLPLVDAELVPGTTPTSANTLAIS